MSKKEHKCSVCGMTAKSRLEIEPDIGQLYICGDPDCKEHAISQLDDITFRDSHQGRSRKNVEYAEWASAVSIITMVVLVIGYLVYKFLL